MFTVRWAILRANGADAPPLFRFPYGDVNSRVLADVNGLGYVAVRWTVDSLGWQGTSGGQSIQSVINRVLAAAQPGEIVLMHLGSNPDDGTTLDAAALPAIIDGLRARGYSFVTLQALSGQRPSRRDRPEEGIPAGPSSGYLNRSILGTARE